MNAEAKGAVGTGIERTVGGLVAERVVVQFVVVVVVMAVLAIGMFT